MAKRYIITLTAANRVGILAAVGNALDELSGNLHEVSQTVMHGFFTIIFAADFPDGRAPQVILDHLRDVCRPFGGEVCVKDPETDAWYEQPNEPTRQFFLAVSGKDQPGILRRITVRLAERRIDIRDLYGLRSDADQSCQIVMGLSVPTDLDTDELRNDLQAFARSLDLSLVFQDGQQAAATDDPCLKRLAALVLQEQVGADAGAA